MCMWVCRNVAEPIEYDVGKYFPIVSMVILTFDASFLGKATKKHQPIVRSATERWCSDSTVTPEGDLVNTWYVGLPSPHQPRSMIFHGSDHVLGRPYPTRNLNQTWWIVSGFPTQCRFCQQQPAHSPIQMAFAKSHRCYNDFVMDNLCQCESNQASFFRTRGQGLGLFVLDCL